MSGPRGVRVAAIIVVAISVPAAITAWFLPAGTGFALSFLPFTMVGALLMIRVPDNRIGWVLAAVGFLVCTGAPSAELATTIASSGPSVALPVLLLAWYGEWYWVPFLYLSLVAFPLLLPDGRPTSPRIRRIVHIVAVSAGVATASAMFQRDLLTDELSQPLPNPVGFLPYGDIDFGPGVLVMVVNVLALGVVAIGALLRKFRRASALERQQLKAIVFGVLVNVVGFVLFGALEGVLGLPPWTAWIRSLLYSVVPLSVLVAVTRYRLYEIDRIISRTATYATVTIVLVTVYAAIAVLPSAVLDLESDLLVAAATLAAAGMFVPVRRRVQQAVDRRFNRARYDAARVVERFGDRLRHTHDLAALHDDLHAVVRVTVQPAHVSLWVRGGAER